MKKIFIILLFIASCQNVPTNPSIIKDNQKQLKFYEKDTTWFKLNRAFVRIKYDTSRNENIYYWHMWADTTKPIAKNIAWEDSLGTEPLNPISWKHEKYWSSPYDYYIVAISEYNSKKLIAIWGNPSSDISKQQHWE